MTEKRFKITDNGIEDTVSNKQYSKIKSSDNILDSISYTHLIDVVDLLNDLSEENKQLKQTLQEVYNDDYYLKQFITAIINVYSKNNGVSPIRLEMIWDSSDMDKTSLKHLKNSFYE